MLVTITIVQLFYLFQWTKSQPCSSPIVVALSPATVVGSCASDIASTSSTDFTLAGLGGLPINNGATAFSVSMWINPSAPTPNGPVYSLFRVTLQPSDTVPSTTDGIRLALYFYTDSVNYNNKGMRMGYAETPSSYESSTDLSQFAFSYTGGNWIYVYAGLDYNLGQLGLYAWETTTDTPYYQMFSASKQSFNTPLTNKVVLNLLYWGSHVRFCGSMQSVNWMPGYYESSPDNVRRLPYYQANLGYAQIYYYTYDLQTNLNTANTVDGTLITFPAAYPNFVGYNLISSGLKSVTLEAITWSYAAKSFTFSGHFNFKALPVVGNNLILFQRLRGSTTIYAIIMGQQASGQIGIIVQILSTQYVVSTYSMTANSWYFLQVSVAFNGAILGQNNALCYFNLVGQDGSYSNNGYFVITYNGVFSTQIAGSDTTTVGSSNNVYPGAIWIRHIQFQTGFQQFVGKTGTKINCLTGCYDGQVSITTTANKCYQCDPAFYLDTVGGQCVAACPANYYPTTLSTSYILCQQCNTVINYYVNIQAKCIMAQCQNGFQEGIEQCDDGNNIAGDGCDLTCLLEIGFKCNAVLYQLTTCVKLCGNGVDDSNAAIPYLEKCDDGNVVSGDGCSSSCQIETALWSCLPYFPTVCARLCGNSLLDQATGQTEQCDDGNILAGDGCNPTCQIEIGWQCSAVINQLSNCNLLCGNGIREATNPLGAELCDDGNLTPNDGCTLCKIDKGYTCVGMTPDICIAQCGNGQIDASNTLITEICDDGNSVPYDGCTNCQVDPGWTCTGGSPTTPSVCKFCGNGKREVGEQCDDGNYVSNDGCTNCAIDAGWTCNGQQPDQCGNCGNGKKEQIEQCDDGNTVNNDGCTNCLIDAYYACFGGSPTTKDTCTLQCPNGIIAGTETCDDNNNVANDGCTFCQVDNGWVCVGQPSICSHDVCGNGLRHISSEQCDDGNSVDGDGCSGKCQIENGWVCQGGSITSKDICLSVCGDGIKVPNYEQCDDGNLVDGDGCSQFCTQEQGWTCTGNDYQLCTCLLTCGNNIRQGTEQCDDGNNRDGDGCSSICLIETGFGCTALIIPTSSGTQIISTTSGDECFKCVGNCATCTNMTLSGCTLCHQGSYINQLLIKDSAACTYNCPSGSFPNVTTQKCQLCSSPCVRCYDSNPSNCFRCNSTQVLNGTQCINACDLGSWQKYSDLKGTWCKRCPTQCTSCISDTICTTCQDYYSLNTIVNTCLPCNLGNQCLGCDLQTFQCTKCILGYRPLTNGCILIQDNCGDGFKSLNEQCDDGNNVNGDGCSRTCVIESMFACRLLRNEGPSDCYNTVGWNITLLTYILEPTRVTIQFSNQILYNLSLFTTYANIFSVQLTSFNQTEFTVSYNNISNTSVDMTFTYSKNVINQIITLTVIQPQVIYNIHNIKVGAVIVKQNLEDVEFYSQSQIDSFTLYANIVLVLQLFSWLLMISGGFLGSSYRMWKVLEAMQLCAVLQFININSFPLNNQMTFDYLMYSNLSFIPNPFIQYAGNFNQSLRRFMYTGTTYYVLNNFGGRFFICLSASLAMYALIKLAYNKFIIGIFEVFLEKLEFSFFFKLYEIFLLDFLVSCLHNIYYSTMDSNWNGTNTVLAYILITLAFMIQIGLVLIILFKEKLGSVSEVQIMFGTLTDGMNAETKLKRIIISQQDFLKKFLIAYGLIYMSDNPFGQIMIIMIPRILVLVGQLGLKIFENNYIIAKEVVTEGLILGALIVILQLNQRNFVNDLIAKIYVGQQLVLIVLVIIIFNTACNSFLIWRLLRDLETSFPEIDDPNARLNKNIDFHKLKQKKMQIHPEVYEEDLTDLEREALAKKRADDQYKQEQKDKNKNREKWNVWDMNREALPHEQKFVSILNKDGGVVEKNAKIDTKQITPPQDDEQKSPIQIKSILKVDKSRSVSKADDDDPFAF